MKNSQKSLAEQLSSLKKDFSENNSGGQANVKTKKDDVAKSFAPCKELTSDFLLLTFKVIDSAIIYREQLWDSASISTKVFLCRKCSKYHLHDVQGLPIAGKETFNSLALSLEDKPYLEKRYRCSSCTSSEAKPKAIFNDLLDAQRSLDQLSIDVTHTMYAYICPIGEGLHLTKSAPRNTSGHIGALRQSRFNSKKTAQPTESSLEPKVLSKKIKTVPDRTLETITSAHKQESHKEKRLICLSCNYKLNLYSDRKCAMCESFGPYDWE
jgi:hypothetical protein